VQESKPGMFARYCKIVFSHIVLLGLLSLTGCGPTLSSPEEIRAFEEAGPLGSEVEADGITRTKTHIGPYKVVCGDILEFQMPAILRVISANIAEWLRPTYGIKDIEPYLVRVSDAGTITLPIVGKLPVAGKTLANVEEIVINAYYPKYVVDPPMVVCKVAKYRRENERIFTVLGLVNKPDAFPYPPDVQYNLMEALAFAGGLDMVADPRYVKVFRQNTSGKVMSATFSIDSKSLFKAYGVAIKPGDVVYVDHTLSTRTNKFLSQVFQFRVGADVRPYID
jgi:protein involved in polysaccharide export with SLBB domain